MIPPLNGRTNARSRSTVDLVLVDVPKCSDSRRVTGVRLSEKPPGFLDLDKASQFRLPSPRSRTRTCIASDLGPRGPGRARWWTRSGSRHRPDRSWPADLSSVDSNARPGLASGYWCGIAFSCLLLPSNWNTKHSKFV